MADTNRSLKAPESLDDLIKSLYVVFEDDHVNVEEVQWLMESYKSNEEEWRKYANYDPHRYTRNLVDQGNGKFNLIVLCWAEGQGSSVHDHSNSHCFMKVLDGCLKETLYDWPSQSEPEKPLVQTRVSYAEKEQVVYINDSIGLHRVENESHSNSATSLHLYVPAFDICQSFDQRTGHSRKCKVTFWSKNGVRTPFIWDLNGIIVSLKG